MRLKKNRAERNREFLDGLARAPEAFARVVESARRMAKAFKRAARCKNFMPGYHPFLRRRRDKPIVDTGQLRRNA